ncbi:MAG: tol-pal system protein YbgF [Deltaproteobacteria bacterium]|uniref:Tol-pal system protein YbgF n=1 Tax=Candidatus Zymogenus saltonus TaxID=2844893 RepID=A0A9D8KFF4_9DELT|nr:tol-pal system protein YbgF [Candidatus Zymogenus saltonus]
MFKVFNVKALKHAPIPLIIVFLSSAIVSSCASMSTVDNLQREVSSLREEMSTLKDKTLERSAETGANYYTVQEELKSLRGTYEESAHEFEQGIKDLKVLKEVVNRTIAEMENRFYEIEKRLAAIEKKLGITPPLPTKTNSPTDTETETTETEVETTESPKKPAVDDTIGSELGNEAIYNSAKEKFQKKDYDGAIESYEAYLKAYPKSPLADNSRFGVGDCYYEKGDYERAILEYSRVIKEYPDGNKVASSLLKIGYAFAAMGDTDNARSALMEVIKKYPGEPQAELAKKKLEKL